MKEKTYLDGKTWLRYSISVWGDIVKTPEERKIQHPAKYPVALVERLLDCYLWHKGVVLDPFLGSGSTLLAALRKGHSGVGFDIVPEFCLMSMERLKDAVGQNLFSDGTPPNIVLIKEKKPLLFNHDLQKFFVVLDDARNISWYLLPKTVDIVITSPPYWNVLRRPRTALRKQTRYYSNLPQDLGNVVNYKDFLGSLRSIFIQIREILKDNAYCIINVSDIRHNSELIPYHADVISVMQGIGFLLKDIIIWDRSSEYNNLRPLGYPYTFIVNKVHEYILVFMK